MMQRASVQCISHEDTLVHRRAESWFAGIDSDPLADSDEERNDNHLLLDYSA